MADFAQARITMVDTQVRPSDVTSFPIIEAMLTIPREEFVPTAKRDLAYVGGPVPLAPGRALLDARVIGKMLDAIDITPEDSVLEIGAGMGYITALLSRLAQAIVAIEEDADLAAEAEAALGTIGADNAAVITGTMAEGSARNGPYDAIFISGAVETVPPALLDQLRDGGRIVAIFMEGALGEVRLGLKGAGGISWRMEFNATAEVLPGFAKEMGFVF